MEIVSRSNTDAYRHSEYYCRPGEPDHDNQCLLNQYLLLIIKFTSSQSLWRRRGVLRLYGPLLNRIKLARERTMAKAAIKIQSAWRSFIVFSSYVSSSAASPTAVITISSLIFSAKLLSSYCGTKIKLQQPYNLIGDDTISTQTILLYTLR